MWNTIMAKVKGVLSKLGIIKTIKNVSQLKEIPIDDEAYQQIDMWKLLYQGYCAEWHHIVYHTVNGEKRRRMMTLHMPKVICNEMASLIFNEKCEISISDETLAGEIYKIFNQNRFDKHFQIYLEYMFALGGMVVKPYFEDNLVKLSFVTADCFIPISWDNQGVREALFVDETQKGSKKYTLLEWHQWQGDVYVIKNELFESESKTSELGHKVPLSILYPELDEEVMIHNFKRPNFVYFKPNIANNLDMQSPLGISLFADSLDTLHTLDIAFDSYQREFRLGKRRIIVPATAVRTIVDDEGYLQRYFDANDEVYQALGSGDMDSDKIQDCSVELRVEEHIAAINSLLNLLAMQTGFSAGSFAFDGKSMKTATEVVSENSKTFKSKQSHENIIEEGLTELIECIVQTAELYGVFSRPSTEWDVTILFDDSIAEDRNKEIDKQTKMVTAGLQSRKRAIMKLHGLTEEEALDLLEEIMKDKLEMDAFFMESSQPEPEEEAW